MYGKITITNHSPQVAVIDIEGVIGVPEQWQFEEPGQRVATYERFRASVESLAGIETPEIIVNIRSTGGNVNDALLIFDALKALNASITTKCFGYVASAATIIAQAASEGRREISANALYLIHRAVCATEGNADELSRSLDMLAKTDERIAGVYASRSGRDAGSFTALMNENNGNGRWLSPEEVVGHGLADRIVGGGDRKAAEGVNNVETKRNIAMNISKKWNALMQVLGFAAHREASEETLPADIGTELPEVVDAAAEAAKAEIERLQAQVSVLEMQNARLAALPTATQAKEDPSPQEVRRSPNYEAYEQDLKNLI